MTPSTPQAVFVIGHQRSGTNLLFNLICEGLEATPYNEGSAEAFHNFRLHQPCIINRLVAASRCPSVFKPISQTINFVEIIDCVPDSKAVFIFRNPLEVVVSSLREFGSAMNLLNHDIYYNFVQNKLQDLRIQLPDWNALDRITERYRSRFSLTGDFASKFALNWLLLHVTLLQRGIDRHPATVVIAYDDLVEEPQFVEKQLSQHLQTNIALPRIPSRTSENYYFVDSIDIQLAQDCLEIFQKFKRVARQ
jgi:hypothetical protein